MVLNSFAAAIRQAGMIPPDRFTPGLMQRFPGVGKGPANRAGWCILQPSCQVGTFGCWATGLRQTWHVKGTLQTCQRPPVDNLRAQIQAATAAKAIDLWNSAYPADRMHPYLVKKGIQGVIHPAWLRSSFGRLIVPLRDAMTDQMTTLQYIDRDGSKRFLKGGRTQRAMATVGKMDGDVIAITEGFANAAIVQLATGWPAIATLSATNLPLVATILKTRYKQHRFVICADHDRIGIEAATKAQAKTKGTLIVPGTEGDDFCDIGIDTTREILMAK